MTTTATPLPNGSLCIKETLADDQAEIQVHIHQTGSGKDKIAALMGLRVKSARLGVILEEGYLGCS